MYCAVRVLMIGVHDYRPFEEQLDLAYDHFKNFLKVSKIRCSQPAFTVKLVARFIIAGLRCVLAACLFNLRIPQEPGLRSSKRETKL